MINVIIVDDEPLVRIALCELIQWESLDCKMVGQFSNGKEALAFLKHNEVELVIIDVNMPIMNGLEFLEELKKTDLTFMPLSVVLSAYSNYDYIRNAFLHGASDYIVKDNLEEEYVNKIVEKSVNQLKLSIADHEKSHREMAVKVQNQIEEDFFQMINNDALTISSEISERYNSLNQQQVIACLLIDHAYTANQSIDMQKSRFIMSTIKQVLESNALKSVVCSQNEVEYVLNLEYPNHYGTQKIRDQVTEVFQKISNRLKQYTNCSATIGVSDTCSGWKHWKDRYTMAKQLAQLRFYNGTGRIYFSEHNQYKEGSTKDWDFSEILKQLSNNKDWETDFLRLLKVIESSGYAPLEEQYKFYKKFLWELGGILHTRGLTWEHILPNQSDVMNELSQFDTMEELHRWLEGVLQCAAELLDPNHELNINAYGIITKAQKYMDTHYSEPISLASVAEKVGISESYLSRLFVKETGVNFIDYITNVRVEKAILLIKSGMKVYEIAERVGYPNQSHFSRVFKRVTGESPLMYKKNLTN